jgi:hypothetical protein
MSNYCVGMSMQASNRTPNHRSSFA